jgi:serine/threonine protein kinase
MIGQRLRDFEIIGELGSGGYGAVYRAHDTSVNREVAMKVILPELAQNDDFKQRFDLEAHLIAQLEHPHIVPLYAYWQDERGAFLVMRYVRGGSLRQYMAQQGPLSLVYTLRILQQIGDALDVAHTSGIVHRDLKPENILIDERGNAYLTDFGIAKKVNQPSKITETDAVVGTWAYLSPEQLRAEPVSNRSDIYAFGILIYELLAGEHPFKNISTAMLAVKHLQESLPSLHEIRPDLPDSIDNIISMATAKKPEDRYSTTMALIADLTRVATLPEVRTLNIPRKKVIPSTSEQRNRHIMLENVRVFWIEGILENALQNGSAIQVGMKRQIHAVITPWDSNPRKLKVINENLPIDYEIMEVFDKVNGKLLILGDPGSGKTTSLLELTRGLLARAEADEQYPIPVVFNLSSWGSKRIPLSVWLTNELIDKYQIPKKVAQDWIANNQLLVLLDGLDEVGSQHREVCIEAINNYRKEHGFVDIVVCSRITDYDVLTNRLKLNGAVTLQPLSDEQIDQYLAQIGPETSVIRDVLSRDDMLREMARTPLMLSIITLAYRGMSAKEIPQFDSVDAQRKNLFAYYVQSMFERSGTANTYTLDQINAYLRWLAQHMIQRHLNVFFIENLNSTWFESRQQRNLYSKSLYVLPVLLLAAVFGLLVLSLPFGLIVLLIILFLTVSIWSIFIEDNMSENVQFFEAIRWRWQTRKAITGVIIGLAIIYFGTPVFGILIGIGLALALCLELLPSQKVATRTQANQVIRRSNEITLLVALIWGLMGGVSTGIIWGLTSGLLSGLAWTLFAGLFIGGGSALLRYFLVTCILWLGGQIPRNFVHFLDHGTSLIILRRIGGGYIFVHRYLRDYFAGNETSL